ncbi:MAG TPA: hypothetical protein VII06_19925 [Chloroflexota bacterium]
MARCHRSRNRNPQAPPAPGGRAARAARRRWLLPTVLGTCLAVVAVALAVACAASPKPLNPGPPVVPGGGLAQAQQQHAARPTPPPDRVVMLADDDVVAAAEAFVQAIFDKDDATAEAYQPGYGPKVRENEDTYDLLGMSARPITWTEFGYPDADPNGEFAEVAARVQSNRGPEAGTFYYKIGFKRDGDKLTIDQWSKRMDVR